MDWLPPMPQFQWMKTNSRKFTEISSLFALRPDLSVQRAVLYRLRAPPHHPALSLHRRRAQALRNRFRVPAPRRYVFHPRPAAVTHRADSPQTPRLIQPCYRRHASICSPSAGRSHSRQCSRTHWLPLCFQFTRTYMRTQKWTYFSNDRIMSLNINHMCA